MSQRRAACGRSDMPAMIAFRCRRFRSATGISPHVSGALRDDLLLKEGVGDPAVADARAFLRLLPLWTRLDVGDPCGPERPGRSARRDARYRRLGLGSSGYRSLIGGQETRITRRAVQVDRPRSLAKAPSDSPMTIAPRSSVGVRAFVHATPLNRSSRRFDGALSRSLKQASTSNRSYITLAPTRFGRGILRRATSSSNIVRPTPI